MPPPPIGARPCFPDGRHPGYSPCWTWRRFRCGPGSNDGGKQSEAARCRRPVGLLVFLSAAGFLLPPPPGELHSPPLPSTSRHAELDEQKRGGEKRRLRGELAEAHAHNGSAVFGSYGGGHSAQPIVSFSLMTSPGKEEAAPYREEEATAGRFSTGYNLDGREFPSSPAK